MAAVAVLANARPRPSSTSDPIAARPNADPPCLVKLVPNSFARVRKTDCSGKMSRVPRHRDDKPTI